MLEIRIQRDGIGQIRGVKVSGHAGYAPPGRDIVCAAVSAVVQTAIHGLEERFGLKVAARLEKGDVYLRLPPQLRIDVQDRVQDVLEVTVSGLKVIANQYREYVSFVEESASIGG